MSQINHFLFINEVYFGATYDGSKPDKTRDYLNKDFGRVLYNLIQHDVLIHVFSHNPIKYAALANISETFDHGLVINLRKLLKAERKRNQQDNKIHYFTGEPGSCTGGDFIEDLYRLKRGHLEEIITSTKKIDDKLADFFFGGAAEAFSQLKSKVGTFKSKNYYRQLVQSNEAIGLHKNCAPIKGEIVKQETLYKDDCPFPINRTVYKSKFHIDARKVAECLNELSEIICDYQSIMFSRGVSFFVPHDRYLKPYITQCFTMFGEENAFTSAIDLVTTSIIENLGPSLKASCWSYE